MSRACQAIGLCRATAYRRLNPRPKPLTSARRPNHRRLSDAERTRVLEVLDSERFVDQPPREVYATLLGEGTSFVRRARCIGCFTSEELFVIGETIANAENMLFLGSKPPPQIRFGRGI